MSIQPIPMMFDQTVPQALAEVVGATAGDYVESAFKVIGIIAAVISAIVIAEMLVYFRRYLPRRGRARRPTVLRQATPGSDPN